MEGGRKMGDQEEVRKEGGSKVADKERGRRNDRYLVSRVKEKDGMTH